MSQRHPVTKPDCVPLCTGMFMVEVTVWTIHKRKWSSGFGVDCKIIQAKFKAKPINPRPSLWKINQEFSINVIIGRMPLYSLKFSFTLGVLYTVYNMELRIGEEFHCIKHSITVDLITLCQEGT